MILAMTTVNGGISPARASKRGIAMSCNHHRWRGSTFPLKIAEIDFDQKSLTLMIMYRTLGKYFAVLTIMVDRTDQIPE